LYEGLRAWQRVHESESWPARLSELRDEGLITDPRAWVCPLSERFGDLKGAPASPTVIGSLSNPESNYFYELSSETVEGKTIGETKDWTKAEWKMALMRTSLGKRVPVLRCMKHAPAGPGGDPSRERVLNVSANGRFFESGSYWEYLFSDIRPEPYTMAYMVRRHPGRPGETHEPRPADLGEGCLDLDRIANANPELPWIYGVPDGLTLARFLEQTRFGANLRLVAFDARRLVQATGALVSDTLYYRHHGFPGQCYPERSEVLSLGGRSVRRIHLLHATGFQGEDQQEVGWIEITFRGLPPRSFGLIYGRDTGWWRAKPVPGATLAYSHTGGADTLSLYRSTFEMTSNEARAGMEGIRLVANTKHTASPFVLGLTAE